MSGFEKNAVLRWRLAPGQWALEKNVCWNKDVSIEIDSDKSIVKVRLMDGWESRYYLEKTRLPVLEASVTDNPAKITTVIRLPER